MICNFCVQNSAKVNRNVENVARHMRLMMSQITSKTTQNANRNVGIPSERATQILSRVVSKNKPQTQIVTLDTCQHQKVNLQYVSPINVILGDN